MEWPAVCKKKRSRRNDGIDRKPLINRAASKRNKFAKKNSRTEQTTDERRQLRSGYGAIRKLISVRRDDITRPNSENFMAIMAEVDNMHKLVKKPREQAADAGALLGLAGTLEQSVRSQITGISPADLVSCLLKQFGRQGNTGTHGKANKHIRWKDIGLLVSPIFRDGRGCFNMLGPMKSELKQRKARVYRKRTKLSTKAQPKVLERDVEEKTDTDKNMIVMFEILRQKRTVKLENLLLNRKSFAQTVENLFTLSFLVKDGRVLIAVDETGSHIVSPRNAPASTAVVSREVEYSHFIFRLDFCDWKLMKALVPEGHELMPARNGLNHCGDSKSELVPRNSQSMPKSYQFETAPKNSQSEIGLMSSQTARLILRIKREVMF